MTLRHLSRPVTHQRGNGGKPSLPPPKPHLIVASNAQKSGPPDIQIEAKALMGFGFKILPLEPAERGVARSGKAPLTRHGVHDATNDFATFKRLVGSRTAFNIAIATGSASDVIEVIVMDNDPRNGGRETLAELIERLGPLPPTLTCDTGGGGWHRYFQKPRGELRKKLGPGVDLLADGRYAVAPPSMHSSGRRYRWREGRGPTDLEIAALPRRWLEFIRAPAETKKEPAADEADAIAEGSRNTELTGVAGQLRRAGLSEPEMLAALLQVNKARCTPPTRR